MSEVRADLGFHPTPVKPERKQRLAPNFVMPEQWIQDGYSYRKAKGLSRINVRLEADRWINYCHAHGAKYVNHHRAWLNWLISPFCKGEIEREPTQDEPWKITARNHCKLLLKGIRLGSLDPREVRLGIDEGIISAELARRYGF